MVLRLCGSKQQEGKACEPEDAQDEVDHEVAEEVVVLRHKDDGEDD